MTARVAIYARYSSDLQRESSIEDQVRMAELHAQKMGWKVVESYSDHAISGASMRRPGLLTMLQDAASGMFDIVLTEGLDRISRDQEHVAGIYKQLTFAGVKICSISDGGIVNELHIGFKGVMNHIFLKDMALKIKRGLAGRIAQGKASGARTFGYDIVRRFNEAGEPVKGERAINKAQAQVVRRIFEEYANGKSPRQIAKDLNRDNISSPKGTGWASTAFTGNRGRGTGILNNELFIGRMIWNKRSIVKNPLTEQRVSRLNPRDEWVITEVPELRIIPQDLWDRVKAKQKEMACNRNPERKRRPKTLLSGLVKCGCCGAGYSKMSATRYYCSASRKKASCDNRLSMRIDKLESTVLYALKGQLFKPEIFNAFCSAYEAQMKELSAGINSRINQAKSTLSKLARQKSNIMQAIKDGLPAIEFKDELAKITSEREKAEYLLNSVQHAPTSLNGDLAQRYQEELNCLQDNMTDAKHLHESTQLLQQIVKTIILTPNHDNSTLEVTIHGDIAGMLAVASQQDTPIELIEDFLGTPSCAETDDPQITGDMLKYVHIQKRQPTDCPLI